MVIRRILPFACFLLIGLCGCHPVVVTPTPTLLSVPTLTPSLTSTQIPSPTPTPTDMPRWMMYEAALLKTTLHNENGLCEWTILGTSGNEVYVYTLCKLKGPIGSAMSGPAVIYLAEDGSIEKVAIPGDGANYPRGIRTLFPPDIQARIHTGDVDGVARTRHLETRIASGGPPLIVVLGTPLPPTMITAAPSPTPEPDSIPTETPFFISQPVIRAGSGEGYETVFSLPVGRDSIIKYNRRPNSIQGLAAIAILPDDNVLFLDAVANRLLYYDRAGNFLGITLFDLAAIQNVRDLRVKGSNLYLLEMSDQQFWAHRMSLDRAFIASYKIPYRFPIDATEKDHTLEDSLTGMAIDCDGSVILEAGGSKLFHLVDVQNQSDPGNITQGYFCNDQHYWVTTTGSFQPPRVNAGDVVYETSLTHGQGNLSFLDVFPDGSFYLLREDVVSETVVTVDQTVHYVSTDGVVQGAARIPISEFYYPIMRSMAISTTGEVFVLLPRPDRVDIVRLNFYQHLEPLIPGAAIPQITSAIVP